MIRLARHILSVALAALLFVPMAWAQSVVANRAIQSRDLIGPDDVMIVDKNLPGALTRIEDAIGREARVNIYSGRPVRPGDVAEPAVVERNDTVVLLFKSGGLSIKTEGRALNRASVGDMLRVMNLSSKSIVSGLVRADSVVEVSP